MASRKAKQRPQFQAQPSDYETDVPAVLDLQPPPLRSNDELNLAVIRRHNPAVTDILSIAPYAVVYIFSPTTQQWEKNGIEGTLFICELTPSSVGAKRYCVTILNRRGLDNFYTELLSGDDVENTDEYIILQAGAAEGAPQIYGLWIFSEPLPSSTANMRTMTAQLIQECATQAESSRKMMELRNRGSSAVPMREEEDYEESSVPMGRQLSLRELFGQQRAQDSGWSVQNHHSPVTRPAPFSSTPETDFFRSSASLGPQFQPNPAQFVDLLGQLKKNMESFGRQIQPFGS